MEKAKIKTKKGRIITLTIIERTETHISGDDLFGMFTKIKIKDIDSLLPIVAEETEAK